MKTLNKIAAVVALGSIVSAPAFAQDLAIDSAKVNMTIGLYAAVADFSDLILTTTDTDGAAGAVYSDSMNFNLESNGQVRVVLEGTSLVNGDDVVTPEYSLDDSGLTFDTAADSTHNASHKVAASVALGEISAQHAGGYEGDIFLTVSAI